MGNVEHTARYCAQIFVCFWHLADVVPASLHVRFGGQSGHPGDNDFIGPPWELLSATLDKSTTSPLVPLSIADAMCLPTASLAAFTGSSARWA